MSNYNDNPVPRGPPDLCFDSSSFTKESFSVDQFLQEHRNRASLETMRDDLGLYLKVLRSAMIDLINKDYADFVNLSSNLIGLDKAINDIQLPLGQLREELLEVRQSLDGAASEVSLQLGLRRDLRERKRSILSLNRVQTSLKKLKILLAPADEAHHLELQVLERIVAEFIHLQFHMSRCLRELNENDSQVFAKLGETLLRCVDRLFLDALSKEESGKPLLLKTLCLYQSLDKLSNAEGLYRKKIVSRALESVITEDFLRSSPQGLPGLYKKILSFVDTDMKCIREVEEVYNKNSDKNKCNFFLKSFWPEVEERLEMNLTSIFSPGDPEVFYKRYTDSLKFLESLLNLSGSETSVQELQSHPNFINFMDRWDLPVYFQIRFQEIVRNLEAAFEAENWKSNSDKWKLIASETTWNSLHKCWEDGIFLIAIAHKFWKLSLQIMSRYTTWTRSVIQNKKVQNKSEVNFLVFLYTDIEVFLSSFTEFKKSVITKLPEISEHTVELLQRSWSEWNEALSGELDKVSGGIVKRLSGESMSLVRQVNDIPRVYRRTNREPPTKPCPYITQLLALPTNFYTSHNTHPKAILWLQTMFSTVTKQYYTSVAEVLDSVQKTEESLRRLKKARDRASNLVPNDRRVEDDNKIRLQLLLDVNAFVKGIEEFGLKKEKIEKLDDLLLLVEATQKS